MAANIFGDRAQTRDHPAWWDIEGTHTFSETLSASEALTRIDADFTVSKLPVYAQLPDGTLVSIDNRRALYREETSDDVGRVLAVVGPDYGVVQNRDVTRALDPLTAEWPVETIGTLGEGETFFCSLKAGQTHVGSPDLDEVVDEYFLVADFKGQGRALSIAYTPTRVVCMNTLEAGLASATVNAAVFHGKSVQKELAFRVDILSQLKKSRALILEKMGSLTLAQVVSDQVAAIVNAAYPFPSAPKNGLTTEVLDDQGITYSPDAGKRLDDRYAAYEAGVAVLTGYREFALERYDVLCTEFPKIAGTAWAAWQAVTEVEDYRRGRSDSAVGLSATFGDRARRKGLAFAAALKVAGIPVA